MKTNVEVLAQALSKLNDPQQTLDLLEDLMTKRELEEIAQRFSIALSLDQGKTFKEITRDSHISSTTVTRVNRCLKKNKGYRAALDQLKREENAQIQ